MRSSGDFQSIDLLGWEVAIMVFERVRCVICGKECDQSATDLYVELKHFEDDCICKDCIKDASEPVV